MMQSNFNLGLDLIVIAFYFWICMHVAGLTSALLSIYACMHIFSPILSYLAGNIPANSLHASLLRWRTI
jgi:hypothetical protein